MTTKATSANLLISVIHKSRQNVLDLMEKQDYNTNEYAKFSINEVNSMKQNNQLDMLLEKNTEDPVTKRKQKMYVHYFITKKITPANIQTLIDDLFNLEETLTKDDTLFIICKDDMNETITNELIHIWEKDGIFIVIESIKRLQFNILNHSLVPKHRVMSEDEVTKVMAKHNIIDRKQFPDISRFDPVARVIGLRPGQVCHIERPSKTAVVADYYRICM